MNVDRTFSLQLPQDIDRLLRSYERAWRGCGCGALLVLFWGQPVCLCHYIFHNSLIFNSRIPSLRYRVNECSRKQFHLVSQY